METKKNHPQHQVPIAIIGMGGLFPNAEDLKAFWRVLSRGEDTIKPIPDTHWSTQDYFNEKPKFPDHTYCTRGGFLPTVAYDPAEFGIPPNILEATDTSQLLGLLIAKRALADAGYGESRKFDRSRVNVVLGVTGTQELVIPLGARLGHPFWRKAMTDAGLGSEQIEDVMERISNAYVSWQENSFPGLLGNVVAGRITNRLDLGGTNCVVDAACASSMGAITAATLELMSGRCDMSITGGVDTLNDIFMHMCFSQTGVLSQTCDVRPFSEKADGTVLGEGIGLLVLKRLEDAERDQDRIYAVLRSMGSSSDGKSQSIYAPNAAGQARALRMAYALAQVDPGSIELVEAHGTGTRVGDAVEVSALKDVFTGTTAKGHRCALGSVKSNIGHTKAAAGAAGLIKAALALHHKVLPPTIKVDRADPKMGIEGSPFYINTQTRPWVAQPTHPRRSGVSAFGFGGSNFHAVLEEYKPQKAAVSWDGTVEIFALGADTVDGLKQNVARLKADIEKAKTFAELAGTAAESRRAFSADAPQRLLMVWTRDQKSPDETAAAVSSLCEKLEKIRKALDTNDPAKINQPDVFYGTEPPAGQIAFIFPGQGSQYPGMAKDLACVFPEALACLDLANTAFQQTHSDTDIRLSDRIYPFPDSNKSEAEEVLRDTGIAQPAIGTVSMMMLKTLERFGIRPQMTCGHSFGELSALHAAGWMDAETFMDLSVKRGKYMADAGSGAMLAVKAPLSEIEDLIKENNLDLVLANRNGPEQGVLSGDKAVIEQAQALCKEKGLRCTVLNVSAAFHSPLVKDAAEPFQKSVKAVKLKSTNTAVFANKTGKPYPKTAAAARKMLGEQLLNPVNFVGQIENMYDAGARYFLEVGPKSVLTGLVRTILKEKSFEAFSMDTAAGRQFGIADLAKTLCRLAAAGHGVMLDQWEDTVETPRKAMMQIPLTGANYRSPAKPKPPVKPKSAPAPQSSPQPRTETPPTTAARPVSEAPKQAPTAAAKPNINPDLKQGPQKPRTVSAPTPPFNPGQNNMISDALKLVSESLKSMQTLHAQTAETHKKFLENQTQASRTLQDLVERTRMITESAIGAHTAGPLPAQPQELNEFATTPAAAHAPSMPAQDHPAAAPPTAETAPSPPAAAVPQAPPVAKASASTSKQDDMGKILLTVVSDLTGYPMEMLQLDMDIEADLGIDSIKRVEILSAFEEKIPDLPAVSPEAMAEMKTLGQINTYLMENMGEPPQGTNPAPATSSQADDTIQTSLLQVVSDLTGYPMEMLQLDMDIEADLGIDSIKRVEILSAFEEKMQDLPAVSPEAMAEMKTLGQITTYLLENIGEQPQATVAAQPLSSSPDSNAVQATLLQVVSDLTGYPMEMLQLDMDFEADLGIDSIKRVEILSAFEEKMPDLPAVSPEAMAEMKTLGQITTYLQENFGEHPHGGISEKQATASPDSGVLQAALLQVVSDLTGYPLEMLQLDMDIEADLGIDSIKRVEILSAFEEKMPDLPAVSPEAMAEMKTLGQICNYLSDNTPKPVEENRHPQADSDSLDVAYTFPRETSQGEEAEPREVERRIIRLAQATPVTPDHRITLPQKKPVYITDDNNGLGQALADAFSSRGLQTALFSTAVLNDADALKQTLVNAAGLVLVPPVDLLTDRFKAGSWEEADEIFLKNAFMAAKTVAEDLMAAARENGALFGTVTRLDGGFGFMGNGVLHPIQGGLGGLAKTAAREWDGVCCHTVDVDPAWKDNQAIANCLADELLTPGPVEIALSTSGRQTLKLENVPSPSGRVHLDATEVVVVTGGARGVTAACAYAVAKHARPAIALLGRSPLPVQEPAWLRNLTDEGAIKKAILANELAGQKATPMELQNRYRKYMANREITRNMERLKSTGSSVRYYPVDVRNPLAVGAVFDQIRSDQGPIAGIIHGAGVLEDRFIKDKTLDQFNKVFDTKVKGLQVLLEASRTDKLKYMVFFSSVSARIGNKGQVDYAMANEVLNKIAQQEAATRKDCRVISINWGPWDGGMVTPALKKEFARQQIQLIPIKAGAMSMLYEMMAEDAGPVEVVLGATFEGDESALPEQEQTDLPMKEAVPATGDDASPVFLQEVGVHTYPILKSHMLGGKPVVPFALMAEWFGMGALNLQPEMAFCGIEDMRVLSGIKLDEDAKTIRVIGGAIELRADALHIPLELRNGHEKGGGLLHSKAKVVLAPGLDAPPSFEIDDALFAEPYKRSLDEAYEQILFHGDQLRGIREIMGYSDKGMVAKVAGGSRPADWMTAPPREAWNGDPLVLDAAFQMAILWSYETHGQVCLPSYSASYRQYRKVFPAGEVLAVLSVTDSSEHKIKADITLLDADRQVLACMTGYEAVMDASLMKAFKPKVSAKDIKKGTE